MKGPNSTFHMVHGLLKGSITPSLPDEQLTTVHRKANTQLQQPFKIQGLGRRDANNYLEVPGSVEDDARSIRRSTQTLKSF
jgi:hypothetical protein